tara:strand:- start:42 stop:254 length:213 start_codon:yes stop_codon:yes gene_type:complete
METNKNINNINNKNIKMRKIIFINNAIEDGWTVKKRQDLYIFTKNHENKKEIFNEEYINTFIHNNLYKKN